MFRSSISVTLMQVCSVQLEAFLRLVQEGREELQNALWKDLHKSPPEGYLTEINLGNFSRKLYAS